MEGEGVEMVIEEMSLTKVEEVGIKSGCKDTKESGGRGIYEAVS